MRLNSDNNLIFSSNEEIKTYKFSQSREEVDLRKENALFPGTFSQMNIFANSKTEMYTRSYRKLFGVIAQIGGFTNGIIFTASMILYIYSQNIILWHCISTIISPKEIENNLGLESNELKNKYSRELINNKLFKKNKSNDQEGNCNQENKSSNLPSNINLNMQSDLGINRVNRPINVSHLR